MTGAELEIYDLEEITREYPHLDKWFSEPSHQAAQIYQTRGTRYLSAQEKLDLAGGIEQMRESLGRKIRNKPTVILAACGIQPMVASEARRYDSLLTGQQSNIGVGDMNPLVRKGYLDDSETIIYLSRLTKEPNRIAVSNRVGFLTTDNGLAELSRRRTTSRQIPRLFPHARPHGI
ncbi:MAG TPA: hypothetical protein VLF93_02485 [Candidatus Saccharimonadales bacterium]|nr:hypothetical protein [Candidatus Saccharimonadales bacterium]